MRVYAYNLQLICVFMDEERQGLTTPASKNHSPGTPAATPASNNHSPGTPAGNREYMLSVNRRCRSSAERVAGE